MALPALVARGTVVRVMLRTVVRVEGASDGAAVETLAARRGLDLAAAGAAVVTMGGAGGADRAVRAAVAQEGHLDRFRTFSGQPEWRGRPTVDRLHRFLGHDGGAQGALRARARRRGAC